MEIRSEMQFNGRLEDVVHMAVGIVTPRVGEGHVARLGAEDLFRFVLQFSSFSQMNTPHISKTAGYLHYANWPQHRQ
jgi:hypothetical protein